MPESNCDTLDDHREERLHWATLCVPALVNVANMALPAAFILVTGIGAFLVVPMILVAVLVSLNQTFRYFILRYEVRSDELVIREGLIEKKERQIPFSRIQNVRVEQKLPHRLFGVADVHIETAGSSGPEAAFTVVGMAQARRLRDVILHGSNESAANDGGETVASPSVELRTIRPSELVLAGMTSQIVATIGALIGLLPYVSPRFDFIESYFFRPLERIERHVPDAVAYEPDGVVAFLMNEHLGKTLVFIGGGLLIAVAGYLFRWFGFRLSGAAELLTWRHGLLTKHTGSVPRKRIQVLKVEEPLLRRLFKLATLKIDTASDQLQDPEDKSSRGVLMPIVPTQEITEISEHVFPEIRFASRAWQKVSPAAIRRGTIKGSLFLLAVTLTILPNLGPPGLWALPAGVVLLWFLNYKAYHHTGYSFDAHVFAYRKGWLNRSTRYVPLRHIHLVAVQQSPFDRRLDLATLFVDTAGQTHTGGMPSVRHLPVSVARALADSLLHPPRGFRRD